MLMIPYARQNINSSDIEAVVNVLKSDWLTQGSVVPAFENAVAMKVGAKFGVAVNSATSALHIACLALGLKKGDCLWTSANTFVASANCALYCGAKVDLIDIDPSTYNMSVTLLHEKLILAEKKNCLPKIIIPVHFSGQSCEMEAIYKLSEQYGFKIIEDASHAIGGRYKNQPIGNCQFSDITIFSFHPAKILTTGEGGMAMTNSPELAEKMNILRSHGITRDRSKMTDKSQGDWYYEQVDLGFNYRMTDIQAALGLSQLDRLDEFISAREKIANKYNDCFQGSPLKLQCIENNCRSAFHLYIIRVQEALRSSLFDYLRNNGINANVHYIPVHLQPYYQNFGFKWGDFPSSEQYYKETITLPIYPALTVEMQNKVIAIVTNWFDLETKELKMSVMT